MAQHVKRDGETVHPLLEQGLDRLRRHVAAGKAGAAGGDDGVDARFGDPSFDDGSDRVDIVHDDLARSENMTGRGDPVRQRGPGFVLANRARIGNRQHRDVQRHEFPGLIDGRHRRHNVPAPKVLQACTVPC